MLFSNSLRCSSKTEPLETQLYRRKKLDGDGSTVNMKITLNYYRYNIIPNECVPIFSPEQHDIHRCFSLHLAHGQIHQTHFSDHDHFLPFFLHPPLLPFFFLYPPPPCGEVGTKEANMAASFSACSFSSFSFLTRCISWHIILCSVQAAL